MQTQTTQPPDNNWVGYHKSTALNFLLSFENTNSILQYRIHVAHLAPHKHRMKLNHFYWVFEAAMYEKTQRQNLWATLYDVKRKGPKGLS